MLVLLMHATLNYVAFLQHTAYQPSFNVQT